MCRHWKYQTKTTEIKGFKLSNFIEPKAIPIALITLILGFCYSSVLSFINFYAIEIDLVQCSKFLFLRIFISSIDFTSIHRSFNGRERGKLCDVSGICSLYSRNAAFKFQPTTVSLYYYRVYLLDSDLGICSHALRQSLLS